MKISYHEATVDRKTREMYKRYISPKSLYDDYVSFFAYSTRSRQRPFMPISAIASRIAQI